ncbi:MAG: hypothetical protein D6685_07215 [Bacteroidetes bacterium]|nr:MAG: hypothetical protein D6685_07215 [Bacteroidota bacterium]
MKTRYLVVGGSLLVLACVLVGASSVQAQTPTLGDVSETSAALLSSQQRHLWRVAAWGGLNAAGGLALLLASNRTEHAARRAFGLQAGLWGLINVGIATIGLVNIPDAPLTDYAGVLSAERAYHDILLLNMGLNVAYSSVGVVMLVAGYRDVRAAASWRGHGTALILQGAGLFVLDGISLLASRTRLADLLPVAGDVVAGAGPLGATLAVHVPF